MKQQNFRGQNRFWILLHYFSLIAVLVFYYSGKYLHWPIVTVIFEIGFLVILLISFFRVFIKTKFWKMVHTSSKNLDEREILAVLNGLKSSYSIFTVICLIIIYTFALIGYHRIDVLLAGALLLLAHTLPAAIVGWNERYGESDID
jgi:hypothetical protein